MISFINVSIAKDSNTNSTTTIFISHPASWLISDEMVPIIFNPIRLMTVSVAIFGTITNVTNILVFIKMGLKNSTNICFFSLAIADLISLGCIFLLFFSLFIDWSHAVISRYAIAARIMSQVAYATSAFGSWATAMIAMERWCCVVFPLKVKTIFTRRTITIALLGVTVYELATLIPYFFTFRLIHVLIPGTNRTQLDFDREHHSLRVESKLRLATFSAPTVVCFSLVLVATSSLIRSLDSSKKLRESMTRQSAPTSDGREARIVKSVILICAIYITGYFINVLKFFADQIYPGIHVEEPYLGNFTKLITTISFLLQAISCSVNIFVYLRMNTQYKVAFLQMFCCFAVLFKY